jgi:8-oxo-dGTP diphosphatase
MNPVHDARFCIRCGTPLIELKDHDGKKRKGCPACGWIYYENPVPAVACVVINENNEVLLVKRKFEPAKGTWALPSGYIEIDQTPAECAIVELKEETGLDGRIKHELGYFMQDSPVCKKVISIGFHMEIVGGELKAGDDAADARFASLSSIPQLPFASHREFLKIVTSEKGINEKNNQEKGSRYGNKR